MAKKLSQISSGGAAASATDALVAVRSGTTDVLITLSDLTNAQVGTSYAMNITDAGKLVTFNNSSAVAVSIVAATTTGFTEGYGTDLYNLGAGLVTLTPATSLVGNAATLKLQQGEGAHIRSDGINYIVNESTSGLVTTQGTFANRPASPPKGWKYYVTDYDIVMIYTGTKWKPQGGEAVIFFDNTSYSISGTGAEANAANFKIPGGMVSATGGFELLGSTKYTNTNATKTMIVRHSATSGNTSTGSTLISTANGGANTALSASFYKTVFNDGGVTAQSFLPSGSNALGGTTSTSSQVAGAIDMGSDSYICVNFNANASDVTALKGMKIKWIEA